MTAGEVWTIAGAVVTSLGGGAALVIALSTWLGRVWAQRILEQDRRRYEGELQRLKNDFEQANRRFQAEIDKTVFVHRMHFETEFRALQEVWRRLSKLRHWMSSLRPTFEIVPREDTPEKELERLNERFRNFTDALVEAQTAIDENRPFLSENIHTQLMAALNAAKAEHTSIRLHPKNQTSDWYETGEKNLGNLFVSSNRVVDLIRARLQELAVLERHVDQG